MSHDLWTGLQAHLLEARKLLVLLSPEAARSEWVRKEVETFVAHFGVDRLGLALTAGKTRLTDTETQISERDNALPEWLERAFETRELEPLIVDLRQFGSVVGRVSVRGNWDNALSSIVSFVTDRPKDEILALHTQRLRRLISYFGALSLALLIATILAFVSLEEAREQALRQQLELSAIGVAELASSPDAQRAIERSVADVVRARQHLGEVPQSTQVALWRAVRYAREIAAWPVAGQQIYALAPFKADEAIIALERDGTISRYGSNGSYSTLVDGNEENAQLSFLPSLEAVWRRVGDSWEVYSLSGEKLLSADMVPSDWLIRDVSRTAGRVLWQDTEAALYVAPIERPTDVRRVATSDRIPEIEEAFLVSAGRHVLIIANYGSAYLFDVETNELVAENELLYPFDVWRSHPSQTEFVAARGETIVTLDEHLQETARRYFPMVENALDSSAASVRVAVNWDSRRILLWRENESRESLLLDFNLNSIGAEFRTHNAPAISAVPDEDGFVAAGYVQRKFSKLTANEDWISHIETPADASVEAMVFCPEQEKLLVGLSNGQLLSLPESDDDPDPDIFQISDAKIDGLACDGQRGWIARTVDGSVHYKSQSEDLLSHQGAEGFFRWSASNGSLAIATNVSAGVINIDRLSRVGGAPGEEDLTLQRGEVCILTDVELSRDARLLAIASQDCEDDSRGMLLRLFDVRGTDVTHRNDFSLGDVSFVTDMKFSQDDKTIYVAGQLDQLVAVDVETGVRWRDTRTLTPMLWSLAVHQDGYIIGGGFWGDLSIWAADGTVLDRRILPRANGSLAIATAAPFGWYGATSQGELARYELSVDGLLRIACERLRGFHGGGAGDVGAEPGC